MGDSGVGDPPWVGDNGDSRDEAVEDTETSRTPRGWGTLGVMTSQVPINPQHAGPQAPGGDTEQLYRYFGDPEGILGTWRGIWEGRREGRRGGGGGCGGDFGDTEVMCHPPRVSSSPSTVQKTRPPRPTPGPPGLGELDRLLRDLNATHSSIAGTPATPKASQGPQKSPLVAPNSPPSRQPKSPQSTPNITL